MLIIVFHTINPLAAPVSNLVGWALPAYLSFKALETPSPNDDIQWLTYWTVFGFFNFIESFAIRLVLYYVPWYYAFKTVFIIWLQLPAFRVSPCLCHVSFAYYWCFLCSKGAQATYLTVLKPVLLNISSQSHVVVPTTTTADAHQE